MGTRPTLYGAVEGGGSKFLCGVATADGRWIDRSLIATTTPDETLRAVGEFLRQYEVERVGVGTFGPLDLRAGRTLATPKPGWTDAPIVEPLHRALGCEVVLDTDVNAACLAEARCGAAMGADPVVYVTVGTGIGVGVVIGGRPVHGLIHPELGHLPAPALDDFPGVCPFHGRCIEGVAGGPALRARLGGEPAEAPDDSPEWVRQGHYLAHLIVAAVLCVSPTRVVVGGGIAQREALWAPMRAAVVDYLAGYLPSPALDVEGIEQFLVPAQLGSLAGLCGALQLALP